MILFLLALSCGTDPTDKQPPEPTFIEVSGVLLGTASSDTGDGAGIGIDENERFEFSNSARSVSVSGTTLDRNADKYPYSEWLEVSVRPGTIIEVAGATQVVDDYGKTHWYIKADAGEASTTVQFASSFGDTHVWLSAVGEPEETGKGGSFATGVTESIPIHKPTIAQLQDVSSLDVEDAFTTSPLFGEFVTVRTEDRNVVVTALTTKGFWVSDLGDAPGNYSGLFVYTFNKPENVEVGDRLALLAGGVQEYVGATQLSFPIYEAAEGETLEPPASVVLPDESLCDESRTNNDWLEAYESSIVTIDSATIPEDFHETEPGIDADPDYNQYLEYGQWPIETPSGCRLYVVSNATVPSFDPVANAGTDVGPITGVVSYVRAGGHKWMLLTRDADDLPAAPKEVDEDSPDPEGPPWPLHPRTPQATQLCEHQHGHTPHVRPTKD